MIRLTIWALPLVLTCVMVLTWPIFSPGLQCVLVFVNIISALFALSVAITPKRVRSVSAHAMSPVETLGDLPAVPRTRADIFARMDDRQFELFSAAVIMAMGEGHRFLEHCGQSGDQGIDSKLLNIYSQPVVVQSKLYAPDNSVGQPLLRDFLGSIVFHRAVYGFFVTTSSFTPAARQLINSTNGRIRAIDGQRLELLLQRRQREIALALRDVLDEVS